MANAPVRSVIITGLLVFCCGVSSAATLVVTNSNDSGSGSLRECINVANATPGADVIAFNIPGPGVHTIALASPLPPLTDDAGVTVNGYTQPGAHPNTLAVGNDAVLLIELNGALAGINAIGIDVQSLASTIRGLVVTGFERNGIAVREAQGKVAGCFVGTDPSGTAARPNSSGILITPFSFDPPTPVTGVVIGGPSPADRNLVAGNLFDGISLFNVSGTAIVGNYVGTDAAGDAALPNGSSGIVVNSSNDTRIGGTGAGERNVLSGNSSPGVSLAFALRTVVEGNFIGTNATGTAFLPNFSGVWVFSAQDNSIGGEAPPAANVIAGNSVAGVRVFGPMTFNNSVSRNSIHDNGGLGIDLGDVGLGGLGVSPNDAGDVDEGANFLQNFPVLASAFSSGGTTMVSGILNSAPQTLFRIEFFSNDACDESGYGEGKNILGSADVTTDSAGNASFSAVLAASLAPGQLVTATATDPDGNTSEFSACRPAVVGPFESIPTLDARRATICGLLLAGVGLFYLRRLG